VDSVFLARAEKLAKLRAEPKGWEALKVFYRDHPVEFVNDWGVTYDPRNAELGLPAVVPFVLFPKQREFIDWLRERWLGREDGLVEKSRDMGVSWLCVAIGVWMWLFHSQSVIGFGSRKEEYVDQSGDPKSLFWKVREFIDYLPIELRPKGYDRMRDAAHMRIQNRENGAVIVGESGDNIGRGNRTSIYFKDESAFYERADMIEAALSQTSNCKIDVSTPNGNGNAFYRKRHSGKVPVFTFHWRDDPRKGEAWYREQVRKLDLVIVAQEIDIDYNASTSDAWIAGDLMAEAQGNGPAKVEVMGSWIVGVDAAHFGDDESVISPRRGRLTAKQTIHRGVDGPQLAGSVESVCDDLGGEDEVFAIVIELDGPGVSCHDQLRRGRYKQKVVGVHTGARLSDGKNYNLKAKMWRGGRDHLASPPASVPPDPELKSQACSVRYSYKDGLLVMEPKKEYKKRMGRSPDRADGWMLTFAVDDTPKPAKKPRARAAGSWMG
jgi:phage terminase large subunit